MVPLPEVPSAEPPHQCSWRDPPIKGDTDGVKHVLKTCYKGEDQVHAQEQVEQEYHSTPELSAAATH